MKTLQQMNLAELAAELASCEASITVWASHIEMDKRQFHPAPASSAHRSRTRERWGLLERRSSLKGSLAVMDTLKKRKGHIETAIAAKSVPEKMSAQKAKARSEILTDALCSEIMDKLQRVTFETSDGERLVIRSVPGTDRWEYVSQQPQDAATQTGMYD